MKMMKIFKMIAAALAFTAASTAYAQSCARLVNNGYYIVSTVKMGDEEVGQPVVRWVDDWQLDTSECTPGEDGGGDNNAVGGGSVPNPKEKICKATKDLYDSFNCSDRATAAPTNSMDQRIDTSYKYQAFWASSIRDFHTRIFNGELLNEEVTGAAFVTAMKACDQLKECQNAVLSYFGYRTNFANLSLTVFGVTVVDLNDAIQTALNSGKSEGYQYSTSAAGKDAKHYEYGSKCQGYKDKLAANNC
jgi:hypothetical protein